MRAKNISILDFFIYEMEKIDGKPGQFKLPNRRFPFPDFLNKTIRFKDK